MAFIIVRCCKFVKSKKKRMAKKNSNGGFVYSTDPNFKFDEGDNAPSISLPPAEQKLRIWLETKHRGGKSATVIKGYSGNEANLEVLGKKLKNQCGTGGAVKDYEIIIQGDHREKCLQFLLKEGYKLTKKAGN